MNNTVIVCVCVCVPCYSFLLFYVLVLWYEFICVSPPTEGVGGFLLGIYDNTRSYELTNIY